MLILKAGNQHEHEKADLVHSLWHIVDSPFGQVFDPPVLLGFPSAGFGCLAAHFIRHVPTVVLAAAL